jgi:hypothetical protein
VYGQDVKFTATVTIDNGAGSPPLGTTVTFTVDNNPSLSATLPITSGNTVAFDPDTAFGSPLPIGTHTITAIYNGETNVIDPTGTVSVTQAVGKATTTTGVNLSNGASFAFGVDIPVVITVAPTLQPVLNGQSIPNNANGETVTVVIDGDVADAASYPLNAAGQYNLTISGLSVNAKHTLQVSYGGDNNYTGSSSGIITFAVTQDQSSLNLQAAVAGTAASGSFVSQPVTFTAIITTNAVANANPSSLATPNAGVDTVTFRDNGNILANNVLVQFDSTTNTYFATFTTSTLAVGNHTISATYGGNTNLAGSTGSLAKTFAVSPTQTATLLSSSPNTGWVVGQPISFTATVESVSPTTGKPVPPGPGVPVPPGTVTFYDDISGSNVALSSAVAVSTNSTAVFTTSSLSQGLHDIVAIYSGSVAAGYATSTSNHLKQQVNYGTATSVIPSANPVVYPSGVTFTAVVSAALGTPASAGSPQGTITFFDGGNAILGAVGLSLVNGQAQFTVPAASPLTIGVHLITATYTPSSGGVFNGSTSAQLSETVQSATTTVLTLSPTTAGLGQPVSLTATVSPVSPGSGIPGGTVNFFNGTTLLGPAQINTTPGQPTTGQAILSVTTLGRGTFNLTATYVGNAGFATSNSNTATVTVLFAATTTLTTSVNPTSLGQTIKFTATVAAAKGTPSGSGVPTGSVSFFDGNTNLTPGGVALNSSNQATFSTSSLNVSIHNITAVYSGNTNFGSSTSNVIAEDVMSQSTLTVATSGTPAGFGQPVTFTATVIPATGTPVPSGTVNFSNNGSQIGSGTVAFNSNDNAYEATFTTSSLSVGTHTITAKYVPDSNSAVAASNGTLVGGQQINGAVTTTTLSTDATADPNIVGDFDAVYSQVVDFTAVVNASPSTLAPSGTVNFFNGGNKIGSATVKLVSGQYVAVFSTTTSNPLPVGTDNITATFVPTNSTNFASSTSNPVLPLIVSQEGTSATITTSPNPSSTLQSVTFTAVISPVSPGTATPTGTVEFDVSGKGAVATGVPLTNGQAVFTAPPNTLPFGADTVSVIYGGTTNFAGISNSTAQNVFYSTQNSVVADNSSISVGQTVNFTATVLAGPDDTAAAGTPVTTGTVLFYDGTTLLPGQPLGGTPLNGSGQATYSTSGLSAGNHNITAVYSGDNTTFAPSTSSAITEGVFQVPVALSATHSLTVTNALTIKAFVYADSQLKNKITALPAGTTATLTVLKGTVSPKKPMTVAFTNGKFTFKGLTAKSIGKYSFLVSMGGLSFTINFSVSGGRTI